MDSSSASGAALTRLATFDPASGELNVVVETPKGSRNKFKYDEQLCLFRLSSVLPAGAAFPFDFGFVPSTLGEDGDPLDVLVLMDEPAFAGCLVPARLVGVVEAEQTESDQTERNDRLIAVAANSRTHRDVRALGDLNVHLLEEIEHFFASYNAARDRQFRVVGRQGPERAGQLVAAAQARRQRERPDL
jgi:inorganic pyrophosphatase